MLRLSIEVNGQPQSFDCNADRTLLEVLRDNLGLTGTKAGCEIGYCGACTVLVNGKAAHSCCLLAGTLQGASIVTIEGVALDGNLTPVQTAFLEFGALQCGYCTPGCVMTGEALLTECVNPTTAEILEYFTGNICRCTGYASIIQAVRSTKGHGALSQPLETAE